MRVRGWTLRSVLVASTLVQLSAQQGPPPEIRSHVQALVVAFNSGSAEQWEAMANEHFAPAALASRSAADRRQLFDRMHADFGATIAVERVLREGPDAPLELHVRGASGLEAVLELALQSAVPYKFTRIGVRVGGSAERELPVPTPPVSRTMTEAELGRALDGYLSKLAAENVFSGVALVARNGTPIFQRAYGYADLVNKVPNTMATRFNLGSINKAFTKTAVAQLVSQGRLSYTDTLGKLIADYPQEITRAATVTDLLEHRAGVADFFGETFASTPKDRFRANHDYYRLVSSLQPLFAPRERNRYCNGCYIVLGEIVERVTGAPYERYVAEHVFKPAGMNSAGYPQTDALEPNVALGYTRRTGNGEVRSNVFTRGAAGSAAGGGYATAADLLAFDNALREGRLLDREASVGFLDGREADRGGRIAAPFGIAGGAPGINAVLASDGVWTVVVLTNLDPPVGEQIGTAIENALTR